jgi:hypothetical protein
MFDFSYGTDNQPLTFRYIENQKWKKLRRMLKRSNGKDLCRERDDSGLTLLGMALGFEGPLDIIQSILAMDPSQITATDFFGASPLHVACLNAASLEAIKYLLQFSKGTNLAETRDKDLRVPLHHIVECLCRNEIDFIQGTKVIETLIQAAPDSIHASDKHNDSPVDLVQLARMEVPTESKEYRRLSRIYCFLQGISMHCYKGHKKKWEDMGFDASQKDVDSGIHNAVKTIVATKSTQGMTLKSSHMTMLSTKNTFGDMEISFEEDLSKENSKAAASNGDKTRQKGGNRLKFWKK